MQDENMFYLRVHDPMQKCGFKECCLQCGPVQIGHICTSSATYGIASRLHCAGDQTQCACFKPSAGMQMKSKKACCCLPSSRIQL